MTQPELEKRAAEVQETLISNVFEPAFVKAAQAHGLPVNTREDLDELLKIAGLIAQHEEKAAAQAGSIYKQAAATLEKLVVGTTPEVDPLAKQAAANPQVAEALRQLAALRA